MSLVGPLQADAWTERIYAHGRVCERGECSTSASTASSVNPCTANARYPLTHYAHGGAWNAQNNQPFHLGELRKGRGREGGLL